MRFTSIYSFLLLLIFSVCQPNIATAQNPQTNRSVDFPGGYQALRDFYETNLRYPNSYKFDGRKAMALLRLEISEDGTVQKIELGKPLTLFLDSEVVRIARLLPKFIPAVEDGKTVKADYKIVIYVKLSEQDSVWLPSPPIAQEQQSQFPGGDASLKQFVQKHLHYPENAKAKGIEGKVVVRFIIGADGAVTNPEVVKSLDPDLDLEAIRIIKSLPNFIPGKPKENSKKVYYTLPIVFSLKSLQK